MAHSSTGYTGSMAGEASRDLQSWWEAKRNEAMSYLAGSRRKRVRGEVLHVLNQISRDLAITRTTRKKSSPMSQSPPTRPLQRSRLQCYMRFVWGHKLEPHQPLTFLRVGLMLSYYQFISGIYHND